MADKLYAWSRIKYAARSKNGIIIEENFVNPGEEVTAQKLFPEAGDRAQVEFDALCMSGAVRSVPYPEDLPHDSLVSPKDHLMRQAMETQEWEGSNPNPGSYFADDERLSFSATEREAAAAREGHDAMKPTPTVAQRAPQSEPQKQANP